MTSWKVTTTGATWTRSRARKRQHLLLGELTHRVKNTLAVVQSIAHQTEISSPSPAAFVERFSGRLAALGNAHGLLVQSNWEGADLAALTQMQLQAHAPDDGKRIRIEGPSVSLPADLATPFGLVLHELATNAAKYGALSNSAGQIAVKWNVSGANGRQLLRVTWRETGAAAAPRGKPGLGSRLIDNAIPGAKVTREYRPDGLVCAIELTLPAEQSNARAHRD